jgi:hypothetical protein
MGIFIAVQGAQGMKYVKTTTAVLGANQYSCTQIQTEITVPIAVLTPRKGRVGTLKRSYRGSQLLVKE